MPGEKLGGQFQGDFLALFPLGRHAIQAGQDGVERWLVGQDDVVDRHAVIDLTIFVELEYRIDSDGRLFLLDVGEGAAVTHDLQRGMAVVEPEEFRGAFAVEASAETLARTTLRDWTEGTPVNLERALRLGDELSGHLVSGHVDGVARLLERRPEGDSIRFTIEAPAELARYIAPKGSVALDGVSLTVNEVEGKRFGVNIIPYTLAHTGLGEATPGQRMNFEIDTIARYVARLLGAGGEERTTE